MVPIRILRGPGRRRHPADRQRDAGPVPNRHHHRVAVRGPGIGLLAAVGERAAVARRGGVRGAVPDHRPGHHGGLPSPVHTPRVPDQAVAARGHRGDGLDGHRGPDHRLGGRPPQAPRLLRPARRPAQPPRGPRSRAQGALRGLWHAHWGWLFIHTQRGNKQRYAPRPDRRPGGQLVDRTFLLWVWWACCCRSCWAGRSAARCSPRFTGLLWGGLIRMLVLHHMTYSINSLCHFFGRQATTTPRTSRATLLARAADVRRVLGTTTTTPSPRPPRTACAAVAAGHLGGRDLALEKTGLAWDVVRVSRERAGAQGGRRRVGLLTTLAGSPSPSACPPHRPAVGVCRWWRRQA